MVHRESNSLAGDLHTTDPTKKDAKEVCSPLPSHAIWNCLNTVLILALFDKSAIYAPLCVSFMGVNAALSLDYPGQDIDQLPCNGVCMKRDRCNVAVLNFTPGMQHHILKSFRRRLKKSSHGSKSQGSQEGMTDIVQMEELEEAERQAAKPAWKTKQFWRTAIPILVSIVLLVVGTVLGAKHYQRQVCVFPVSNVSADSLYLSAYLSACAASANAC